MGGKKWKLKSKWDICLLKIDCPKIIITPKSPFLLGPEKQIFISRTLVFVEKITGHLIKTKQWVARKCSKVTRYFCFWFVFFLNWQCNELKIIHVKQDRIRNRNKLKSYSNDSIFLRKTTCNNCNFIKIKRASLHDSLMKKCKILYCCNKGSMSFQFFITNMKKI